MIGSFVSARHSRDETIRFGRSALVSGTFQVDLPKQRGVEERSLFFLMKVRFIRNVGFLLERNRSGNLGENIMQRIVDLALFYL